MGLKEFTPSVSNTETVDGIEILSNEAKENAMRFLEEVEQKRPIPEISIDEKSSLFVCIPAYRESANAERLFNAWNTQQLEPGQSIEIVICINQKTDNEQDYIENQKFYNSLRDLIDENKNDCVHFSIINSFDPDSRFDNDSNIGDVRNFLCATAIKALLKKQKNAIIMSSDADTFPLGNCAAEVINIGQNFGYGSIDKKTEYDGVMTEEEKRAIKINDLLTEVHSILLEYFTYGELLPDETAGTGGAGFYFSVDKFVGVGGYGSIEFGEDTDLYYKLLVKYYNDFYPVEEPVLINTVRQSDRLDGDGALITRLKQERFPAEYSLAATYSRALLRKIFILSAERKNFREMLLANQGMFNEEERQDILKLIDNIDISDEDLYSSVLHIIEERPKIAIDESVKQYAKYIKAKFSKNEEFVKIFEDNQIDLDTARDDYILAGFIEFVDQQAIVVD